MAKVRFEIKDRDAISKIAKSDAMGDALQPLGESVLAAAQGDPNSYYVSTLRINRFVTGGRKGRVSIQVGAAPVIGVLVEAKRGTLARAMGSAGL